MSDHRFPLQMECLALAIQAMERAEPDPNVTKTAAILTCASTFLGWAQATLPTTKGPVHPDLRPPKRGQPFGAPDESPVR